MWKSGKRKRMQAIVAVLWLASFLVSSQALAAPEKDLATLFSSTIGPWYDSVARHGSFVGVDGVSVHYVTLPNPARTPLTSCALVFSPGQGDFAKEYAEFFYDLRDLGCDGYIIDHRGQGDSARLLKDPQKSHVVHFSDYIDDFSKFMADVVRPSRYGATVLIGESMGGAIAAGYLARYPNGASQAVLLAPMMQIDTSPVSEAVALAAARVGVEARMGDDYAPGEGPEDPNEPFSKNKLTSSQARFDVLQGIERDHPEWRVGGVTYRWLSEAISFTRELRNTVHLFQIPTLLFQAEDDEWVVARGQNQACFGSPNHCKLVKVFGSRHEIIHERDEIRDPVLSLIRSRIVSPPQAQLTPSGTTLVRLIPRADYGSSEESRIDNLEERLGQLGTTLQGKPMGGDRDFVVRTKVNPDRLEIFRCPSVRSCFASSDPGACIRDAGKWSCEELYQDTHAETCRQFLVGREVDVTMDFLGRELFESALIAPIAFFQKGIGLAIVDGSSVLDAMDTWDEGKQVQCGPAVALSMTTSPAPPRIPGIAASFRYESTKGEVQELLKIFTPPARSSDDIDWVNPPEFPRPAQIAPES